MLAASFRHLESPLPPPKGGHKRAPFSGSWQNTLDTLERELRHLKAKDILILADLRAEEIRNDGWQRSGAYPRTPGVVVSFESAQGPLKFACATYAKYDANLRAIGLTLERLRAVDRYGATKSGEQYRGWKQLPPGAGDRGVIQAGEWATKEAATEWLIHTASGHKASMVDVFAAIKHPAVLDAWFKQAARKCHPDAGGSNELMAKVNRARDFIAAA